MKTELSQKGVWLCSSKIFEDAALDQNFEDLLAELFAANPAFFPLFFAHDFAWHLSFTGPRENKK